MNVKRSTADTKKRSPVKSLLYFLIVTSVTPSETISKSLQDSQEALYATDRIRCSAQYWLCNGTGACEFFLLHTSPLRAAPSQAHTSAAPAASSPSTNPPSTSSSSLSSYPDHRLTEQQQRFNFVRLSYPVDLHDASKTATILQKMPQYFLCTWLTQGTGQSTTPPWNLWRQFNSMVFVLHLKRVIEPLSFKYKPSPILFFVLYISRVSLSSTSVLHLLSSHSFTLRLFFLFSWGDNTCYLHLPQGSTSYWWMRFWDLLMMSWLFCQHIF